ncbi:MAG: hypothetical protein COY39_02180 [Alphaproteobacteria bacterium CG_4_10_14_0_8_um_filter_37_21]|nr:MAG: hypothetical protein COY39_02180 [Alphaproteobacteria bacterium CG_4_10_14_0_8_um_filter_37_21]
MLKVLCAISVLATFAALGFGLFCLYKGGDFNKKYGNLAMRMRIGFQFASLALLYVMLR